MASIFPEFGYDIFISYRHNDNRSGWVTEFVRNLKQELAATIKEPVSVYFDSNPYDGLLETHNVDKSLEGKLKCLIFIPILSQTYCDLKSFAWQHEFCAFNKLSREGQFGRDVRLGNGNVTSRILPIKIHDLDADDLATIAKELGNPLRAIEMIYKEPGVNRPLNPGDDRHDNHNKTDYRNQVNKIANAAKEVLSSLQNPEKRTVPPSAPPTQERKDTYTAAAPDQQVEEKSLAVLPLIDLSNDPSQEYFADGITENIITQLAGLPELRLISRTSVMRFKKTTKSVPEIAGELAVKYILEGSVQLHKEKVRISIKLINALQDKFMWTKVFTENIDDIFEVQSNVAETVAKELHASFSPGQSKTHDEVPTKNLEAYDLFLKGRHAFNQWGVGGYKTASVYFKKAIELDPGFREAYSYLASSYSARMSWNGDLSPKEALENIEPPLAQAWKLGPSDNDYLTKAFIEFFVNKDLASSEKLMLSAIKISPNNVNVLYAYSYVLNLMGRFEEAASWVEKAKKVDPLTIGYFNHQAISLYFLKKYDAAVATLNEAIELFPSVVRFYDHLGRTYLTMGRLEDAKRVLHEGLHHASFRPPSMVAYLAVAASRLQEVTDATQLLEELTSRSLAGEKGVNIYLVHVCAAQQDVASAKYWLDQARKTNDVDLIWWEVDPLLKGVRDEIKSHIDTSPDYAGAEKYLTIMLEQQMPALQYHNLNHIQDVLQASMSIGKTESVTDDELKTLRVAALLHDAGFIHSSKNHEQRGAEMASEILPSWGFSAIQVEVISKMILTTRLPQSPSTKLERILCDADLDYLGRDDFYEIGGRLFEELKVQGLVDTEREWNLVQKTFLESHHYHTNFGQSVREPRKRERLQEVIGKLKR